MELQHSHWIISAAENQAYVEIESKMGDKLESNSEHQVDDEQFTPALWP